MLTEFLLASLLIEITPGPNMLWLALLSANEGRRAGALAVAGIAAGLSLAALLASIGVAQIAAANPALLNLLGYLGAGFMFWLAWEAWSDSRASSLAKPVVSASLGRYFARGVAINLLNAKAFFFFLTVLPGFIVSGRAALAQTLVLSALYVAVATAIHVAIVLAASHVHGWLVEGQHRQHLQRVFAVLLVGVGVWMVWGASPALGGLSIAAAHSTCPPNHGRQEENLHNRIGIEGEHAGQNGQAREEWPAQCPHPSAQL